MIRNNIERDSKVYEKDRGIGTFKGWFQASADITIVEWSDESRTVQHKRYLTEIEE